MRGSLLATGEATCNWGAELDMIVVSRGLAFQATLRVVWGVPWKPHAAIIVNLSGFSKEWECWRRPAFAKVQAADVERDWVQIRPSTVTIISWKPGTIVGRWAFAKPLGQRPNRTDAGGTTKQPGNLSTKAALYLSAVFHGHWLVDPSAMPGRGGLPPRGPPPLAGHD